MAKKIQTTKNRLSGKRSTTSERDFGLMLKYFKNRPAIISEGDSWFDYPPKAIIAGAPTNVIDHIQRKRRFNLLRLESSGDEAVNMLTGKQKHNLASLLKKYSGQLDVLLFSGGGNDIVGKWDMESFLKPWKNGMSPEDAVNKLRFRRKLKQIEIAYLSLIDMRDDYCPGCVIITHGYDYFIPSDQGAQFVWGIIKTDPWIKPYMDAMNIPVGDAQNKIARFMIREFNTTIRAIADDPKYKDGFRMARTAGTLTKNEWQNEIHPTKNGFSKIANLIYAEMVKVLPTA